MAEGALDRAMRAYFKLRGEDPVPRELKADVEDALHAVRTPDMNLCLEIGRETGMDAAWVDIAWTRMIDKLLEGR